MNKWEGTGRLVADPTVRYSNGENQTCIANFTLAVNRRFKKEGQPTADFIRCVAMGKSGEFVEKYFHKGMKADVVGHIQTGKYEDKDGKTVYTTDIMVEEIEFGESRNSQATQSETIPKSKQYDNDIEDEGGFETADEGFMNVPDDDDILPFS